MQTNAQLSSTAVSTKTSARTEALAGAFMAAMLGLVMVWGVGFSHIEAVHNAAHDTRHANAFPCH
jgi:cobalt transporter subunit CbtB